MQGGSRGVSAEGGGPASVFSLLCPVWSACPEGRGGLSWVQGCPSQLHSHSAEPAAPLREPRWTLDTQAHPGTHRDMCARVLPPSLRVGRCDPRGGRAKGAAPREPCLPAWTLPPRQWRGAPGQGAPVTLPRPAQGRSGKDPPCPSLRWRQRGKEESSPALPSPGMLRAEHRGQSPPHHAASRNCGTS